MNMADQKTQPVLYWTLRGRLSPDNRLACRPGLLTSHPPQATFDEAVGDLRIELLDRQGRLLVQQKVPTAQYCPEQPEAIPDVAVYVKVPFHPETRMIRLWRGDVLVREWQRPESSPVIEDLSVKRDQGRVRLAWRAHHPSGAPMEYFVRFSTDGGRTFNRLSRRLDATEYAVDETQLPGGKGWIFEVGATDGVNTTTSDSAPLDLPEAPPKVEIASPPDGASVVHGATVLFSGEVVAFIGQSVDVQSIAWTSDRDGKLADRFVFETDQLSPGIHRIELEVVDGHGRTLGTHISIDVAKG